VTTPPHTLPVHPPPMICRYSVLSRSFLLGPSALRGLHLDNPAPATMAATAEPEHNEHPPQTAQAA
jgi:hypothetical protein